jgi:hypothetical protein
VATFGSIDCVRANADIPEQSDFQLEDRLDDEGKLAEPKFKLIDVNVNGYVSLWLNNRVRVLVD